jgi:uncharacterized protein (TIGR01777 family)
VRSVKVVLAGGSGALGRRLAADLAGSGHEVVVLTRTLRGGPHREVVWDGQRVGPWAGELEGSAVVNLAGELVDRRPTPANIDLLTRSRVQPTAALAAAAGLLTQPVPVWLQASTLAIYGDAGEVLLTEASPMADGPPQMAGVARAWENATARVNAKRQVILRTSIVLDRNTPALDRLVRLTRLGLGGRVGSGQQWFSWIHVADWLAITRRCLGIAADDSGRELPLDGVVLATAPNPVRNQELMAALRRTLHRSWGLPSPVPVVHLGAFLLRTDPALALTGRRAASERLRSAGFAFTHPHLEEALSSLLSAG